MPSPDLANRTTPGAPVVVGGELRGCSPIDGRPLSPVPIVDAEAVRQAVDAARAAQPAWARRPFSARVRALKQAARRMLECRAEVLALMREEVGKHEIDALMSEVLGPLDQVKQWARVIKPHAGRRRVRLNPLAFPGKRAFVELVPRGVIGAITPWNYPLGTFFRPVFPALLMGNGVVVKPSEYAPRVARWFVTTLGASLPAGLVGLVPGEAATGAALIDAGIDAATFTGSVTSGRQVARQCAARMIPVSLELGGKDAALVLADCDLPRTVAGITHWALHNVGQNCGAIERVFVETPIAAEFVARLGSAWARLRVGPDEVDAVDVSPLTTPAQLAIVARQVEEAVAAGATLVCGGRATGDGLWYEPTVLDHCTPEMAVMRQETFGPVVAIARVASADEAVHQANACDYGLGASIWSKDTARAETLGRRLEVGVVAINNHALSGAIAALPWSGTKHTGGGIANSAYALTTFARPRAWLVDRSGKPDPFWLPYDADLLELGERLADVQTGRLGRAFGLFKLLRRRRRTLKRFYGGESSEP